jgi:hypothetical protein
VVTLLFDRKDRISISIFVELEYLKLGLDYPKSFIGKLGDDSRWTTLDDSLREGLTDFLVDDRWSLAGIMKTRWVRIYRLVGI